MRLAELYVVVGARMTQFNAAMRRAKARLVALNTAMAGAARAARRMLMGLGAFVAGTAYIFAKFEQRMARVRALTSATTEQFRALWNEARRLGATTVFSASQAAEAMSNFALAGFKVKEIIGAMPQTLNLAAAGQISMGDAAGIVTTILRGMGHSTKELTKDVDILTAAFTGAYTDIGQLGEAMKYVAPVAAALKIPLSEIVALISALSDKGIQATMAGTALRASLGRLAGGTAATDAVLKKLGVTTANAAGQFRPAADIIDDMNAAFKRLGIAGTQQVAMLKEAFGTRQYSAFLALLGTGGEKIRSFAKRLEEAGGVAQHIADIQLDTLQGKLILLKSAAEGAAISIGEAFKPMIEGMSDALKGLANALEAMGPRMKKFMVDMVQFVAGIGVAIVAIKALFAIMTAVVAHPFLAAFAVLATIVVALIAAFGKLESMKMRTHDKESSRARQRVEQQRKLWQEYETLRKKQERSAEESKRMLTIGQKLRNTYRSLAFAFNRFGEATMSAARAQVMLAEAQHVALLEARKADLRAMQVQEKGALAALEAETGGGFWRAGLKAIDPARLVGLLGGRIEPKIERLLAAVGKASAETAKAWQSLHGEQKVSFKELLEKLRAPRPGRPGGGAGADGEVAGGGAMRLEIPQLAEQLQTAFYEAQQKAKDDARADRQVKAAEETAKNTAAMREQMRGPAAVMPAVGD